MYKDISSVPEPLKQYYRSTQFSNTSYRKFNYDAVLINDLARSKEIFQFTLFTIDFLLRRNLGTNSTTQFFKNLQADAKVKSELLSNFIFSMVPAKRYSYYTSSNGGKSILEIFVPETNIYTMEFLKALDSLHNDTKTTYYKLDGGTISRSRIEKYLDYYFPIFKNYFLPVFEITVFNNGNENIIVDKVAVEVVNVSEYMGGNEVVPETDIVTIPVSPQTGLYSKNLKDEVYLRAGEHVKILVRLEPNGKEASYLLKFKIFSKMDLIETELIAIDF